MEWAIQTNFKYFDFTVGDERYKKIWCNTEAQLFETIHSITLKGRIYILNQYLKRQMRKVPFLLKSIDQ